MQEPSPYNSQKETRKTTTLIAGILLLFMGTFMLYQGTSAAGIVDFATPLIKGKIETGSAGLLAIFFGFILIYIGNHDKGEEQTSTVAPIIQMLLACNHLALIISSAIIVVLLILIYLIEPFRPYLLALICLIIVLTFRQDQR